MSGLPMSHTLYFRVITAGVLIRIPDTQKISERKNRFKLIKVPPLQLHDIALSLQRAQFNSNYSRPNLIDYSLMLL